MDTCFIFSEYLNDTGCLCLKLGADGGLRTPLAQRSFADIKTLQQECKTIIVESCAHATLIHLELPWLAERKARAAIPYALEDRVAQPVEALHFAFDKLRYKQNQYLIAVIAKKRVLYLIQVMEQHDISFNLITLDWFALSDKQICVTEKHILINQDDFKGALSGTLARAYLKQHTLNPPLLFQNSQPIADTDAEINNDCSYTWIAKHLLNSTPLNLCQGEMRHNNTSDWVKKGYQLSALLCGFWLASIVISKAIMLHNLNKKTAEVDKQIQVIYKQFFPEAKQVISPKFRISQLLNNNQTDNQQRFWFLINAFAKIMRDSPITVKQLRYQNKTLSVSVISPDSNALERLEHHLKKVPLKINQIEASTHEQQVLATLELQ